MGRTGDAVKVRGMFLHPRHVEQVMARIDGVSGYRFIIDRVEHRDELRCEIVPEPGQDPEELAQRIADEVRAGLRFTTGVDVVPALEESDGPIVDLRTWE